VNGNEWLQDLKTGDKVFRTEQYSTPDSPQIVSRVTKATIFIKQGSYEEKFRRSDGRSIGSDVWNTHWLIQYTPELKEQWELYVLRKRAERLPTELIIPKDKESLVKFIEALQPFLPNKEVK